MCITCVVIIRWFTSLCCYRLIVKMEYRTLFSFTQPVGELKPENKCWIKDKELCNGFLNVSGSMHSVWITKTLFWFNTGGFKNGKIWFLSNLSRKKVSASIETKDANKGIISEWGWRISLQTSNGLSYLYQNNFSSQRPVT